MTNTRYEWHSKKHFTLEAGRTLDRYDYRANLAGAITLPMSLCFSATWRLSPDEDAGGNVYWFPLYRVEDMEHHIVGEGEYSLRNALFDWADEAHRKLGWTDQDGAT